MVPPSHDNICKWLPAPPSLYRPLYPPHSTFLSPSSVLPLPLAPFLTPLARGRYKLHQQSKFTDLPALVRHYHRRVVGKDKAGACFTLAGGLAPDDAITEEESVAVGEQTAATATSE